MDSALGDQTTAGNLLLFEPEGMESENFFKLVHAEPRLSATGFLHFHRKSVCPLSLLNFS